jgi:toxin secretion/phage lysis holin
MFAIDWHVYVLIFALIVIDYVLGVIGAVISKTFSSSVMRQGLIHKFTYLVAIVIAEIIVLLSGYLDLGFDFVDAIVGLVCVWISLTEIGSILENIVKINPKLGEDGFLQIFSNSQSHRKDDSK